MRLEIRLSRAPMKRKLTRETLKKILTISYDIKISFQLTSLYKMDDICWRNINKVYTTRTAVITCECVNKFWPMDQMTDSTHFLNLEALTDGFLANRRRLKGLLNFNVCHFSSLLSFLTNWLKMRELKRIYFFLLSTHNERLNRNFRWFFYVTFPSQIFFFPLTYFSSNFFFTKTPEKNSFSRTFITRLFLSFLNFSINFHLFSLHSFCCLSSLDFQFSIFKIFNFSFHSQIIFFIYFLQCRKENFEKIIHGIFWRYEIVSSLTI